MTWYHLCICFVLKWLLATSFYFWGRGVLPIYLSFIHEVPFTHARVADLTQPSPASSCLLSPSLPQPPHLETPTPLPPHFLCLPLALPIASVHTSPPTSLSMLSLVLASSHTGMRCFPLILPAPALTLLCFAFMFPSSSCLYGMPGTASPFCRICLPFPASLPYEFCIIIYFKVYKITHHQLLSGNLKYYKCL